MATDRLRARLIRDTVYHVVIGSADSAVTVFYGSWSLVTCRWTRIDTDFKGAPGFGRQSLPRVTGRRIWSGERAVPERVVRVVSEASSAEPEDVARVLPARFEISLDGGFALWVVTDWGAAQAPTLGERLHRWFARSNPFAKSQTVTMTVSQEDAQTLYYALEPGTPVIIE